jgi:hypothetical protein
MQDFLTVVHVFTLITVENCKKSYSDKIPGTAAVNTLSYDEKTEKSQHIWALLTEPYVNIDSSKK